MKKSTKENFVEWVKFFALVLWWPAVIAVIRFLNEVWK